MTIGRLFPPSVVVLLLSSWEQKSWGQNQTAKSSFQSRHGHPHGSQGCRAGPISVGWFCLCLACGKLVEDNILAGFTNLLERGDSVLDVLGRTSTISRAGSPWTRWVRRRRRRCEPGMATSTAGDHRLHTFEGPETGDKENLCHHRPFPSTASSEREACLSRQHRCQC